MASTCWSCGRVKGKRVCPARGAELICSKCCGTKRRVEIACPEDCAFLHGADPNWQSAAREKEELLFFSRFLELSEEQLVFLLFVHHVVFGAGKRFRSLSDDTLREVVSATLKTLETEAKGIVYTHHTSSPHLDRLASWLLGVVSAREAIDTAPPASERDVRLVFETLERAIQDHASQTNSRIPYLEIAEQVLGPSLEGAPPLELPPELDEPPENQLIVPP